MGIDRCMCRLDQAGLAHAARAPQQRIVGRQFLGETPSYCREGCRGPRSIPRISSSSTRLTRATGCRKSRFRGPDETIGDRQGVFGQRRRRESRETANRSACPVSAFSASRAVVSCIWNILRIQLPVRALTRANAGGKPTDRGCIEGPTAYIPPKLWLCGHRRYFMPFSRSSRCSLTPAYAQAGGGSEVFISLLPFVLIFRDHVLPSHPASASADEAPSGDDRGDPQGATRW